MTAPLNPVRGDGLIRTSAEGTMGSLRAAVRQRPAGGGLADRGQRGEDAGMILPLTLPLPPKALSPNARGHWGAKARAVAGYRQRAYMVACVEVPASKRPGWERAETRVVFYLPDRRRRDMDNLAASLKAAWDGIADAGIVQNDSGLYHHPPEMRVDKANPRVEIEVRQAT